MKPILKKLLIGAGGTLTLAVGALAIATAVRTDRHFQAPTPDIHASQDPTVIERGRYLARGAAHCADCHGAPEQRAALESGADVPLSGGFEFDLPFGVVRVPNITPDVETGVGRYSDADLARILRHGVKPDGRMALPFMPFADLSTADLTAVISYLRTQAPVHHVVAPHQFNALGKVVKAFMLTPQGPSAPVAQEAPRGPTVENGRYITHNVGNCLMCHSKVNVRTVQVEGPIFGGGMEHDAVGDPKKRFIAPNLTPHPRWGWIASWPEEVFVARMKLGKQREGSPMPWHGVKRLSDDDLRAVYRYLRTVPPAEGGPDPSVTDAVVATR